MRDVVELLLLFLFCCFGSMALGCGLRIDGSGVVKSGGVGLAATGGILWDVVPGGIYPCVGVAS